MNMPKDNIERAIKKSLEAGGANYEDIATRASAPAALA